MKENYLSRKGLKTAANKTKIYARPVWEFTGYKKWLMLSAAFLIFGMVPAIAQTTLISPTGDGGFENGTTFAANGWTAVNAATNTWNVGTVPGWFTGTGGAYISNNSGTAWAYSTGSAQRSHIYRDIAFPAGETNINLSFSWRGNGNDGNFDNLQVYIANTTVTPTTSGPTAQNTTTTGWTGYTNGTTGYYLTRINGTATPTTTTTVNYTFTTAQANYAAGNTRRLIITWKNDGSGGTNPPASIDNISLTSSCTGATASAATLVATTTAQANWAAYTGATSYGLRYKPTSSGTWTTLTGLTGTSTALSSLTAGTAYEYQVRGIGGACSAWSPSVTFTTEFLTPVTWTEGFSTTATPTGWTSSWSIGTSAGGNPGNAIYYNLYGSATSANFRTINVGPIGANDRLRFDWRNINFSDTAAPGTTSGNFVVALSTDYGATWNTLATVSNSAVTTWTQQVYPLAAYAGQNIKLRITATRTSGDYYLGFDNFVVEPTPSCLPSSSVTATATGPNTATLSWNAASPVPGDGYEYYYSTINTAPTAVTTGTAETGLTVNLSSLADNTLYYVWVRSVCGASEKSAWSSAATFTTPCSSAAIPYTENFDTVTTPALPACNTVVNVNADANTWFTTAVAGGPRSTPNSLRVDYNTTQAMNDWYFTKALDLTANISYRLKFWYKSSNGSEYPEKLEVKWGSANTVAGMSGSTLFSTTNMVNITYAEAVADFTPTTSGTYYIGFHGFSDADMAFIYVDDISVTLTPQCASPTAVSVTNVTSTGATVNLTSPATSFIVEYGPTGFTPGTGATAGTNGTVVNGTSATIALTLSAATAYDIYVRTVCTPDYSANTTVVQIITPCTPTNVPYTENFELVTVPALPDCTTVQNPATGNIWATASAPGSGFASKALRYVGSESYNANSFFFTRAVNLTAGTSYRISYRYGSSAGTEKLRVSYGTAPDYLAMTTQLADHPSITNTTPVANSVDFTPAASGVYYFSFHAYSSYILFTPSNLYVDDISITTTPTCDIPATVTVSGITATAATVNWTLPAIGTPTEYEYEVRTSGTGGSGPGTGYVTGGTVAAPALSAALSGLASGTYFTVYVRAHCSGSDYSAWTTGTLFNTACGGPVTTLPWAENFDTMPTVGGGVLKPCWTGLGSSATTVTSANADTNTYNNPYSAPNYTTIFYSTSATPGQLWSPGFTLTAGESYNFSFYYVGDGTSTWVANTYTNTSATLTGATALGAAFINTGTTVSGTAYTLVTRTFTPSASGTYYFGISAYCTNTTPWYLGFDDFKLEKTPSAITSFTPATACSVGGQTVTITGANLAGATAVTFNGVPAVSYSVVNNTTITAVTPAGVTAGNIIVTAPLGTATSTTALAVTENPVVAAITGPAGICTNAPATLSNATTDGIWSSLNTAVATIDPVSGLVTGIAAGTTDILYTVTTGTCSTAVAYSVTIYNAPSISAITPGQTVTPGATATYVVSATGSGLTYQWQESVDNGGSWANVSDATTATLTLSSVTPAMNGNLYRVVVSGTAPCAAAISSPASTLVVSQVGITTHPADITICTSDATAQFSVLATGSGLTYIWEESANGGTSWSALSDATTGGVTYSGSSTSSLSITGLTTATYDGYLYRVTITDAASNSVASNTAALNINSAIAIGTQPVGATACFGVSTTKSFTTSYTGDGTIQWQYSANGTTWANVANATPSGITYSGATAATLVATLSTAVPQGTYQYRAVITAVSPCADVTSDVAALSVGSATVQVSASSGIYCTGGAGVTLTASDGVSYAWAPAAGLSATTGASVVASPSATTTYTVTGTNADGCTATATITVTVSNTPVATATAGVTDVCEGGTVQLDVNAAIPYITPAVSTYQFTNTTGTYTQVGSGATQLTSVQADTAISAAQNIGFTFNYGGIDYTQFKMSSNGFISLNTSGTDAITANNLATANAASRPIIAPLWDDLDGNATGGSYAGYEVSGTAPNRVLTVEWRNWEWNFGATTPVISFQAKLYEGTNVIEFVYRSESGAYVPGFSSGASIGINAPTGNGSGSYLNLTSVTTPAVSSTTSATGIGTKPATGTIYRFSPGNAPALTYAWTSAPAGFTSNIKNPVATVSANTTYSVTVSAPGGCAASSSVAVNATSGGIITAQPVGATLCQGGSQTLSVIATGPGLAYQWRKDGENIAGAATSTYAITNALPAASGSYDVVITPACGSPINSDAVTVTVNPAPVVTTTPANIALCYGASVSAITLVGTPAGVTFDVAGGTGIGLSDLTGVTTIPGFTPTASGTATITVTPKANGCTGTAVTFTITVNPLPTAVTISPSASTICSGTVAMLTATGGLTTIPAYSQLFNTLPAGFTSNANATITANTTYYSEGTGSVLFNINTTSANANYGPGSNIDLSGYTAAQLTFSHIAALEGDADDGTTYDAGRVQYSADGGATWTLFPVSSYAGSGSLITEVDGASVNGVVFSSLSYPDWSSQFTSSSSTPGTAPAASLWKTETINIPTAALTSQFRVRFRITNDGSVSYYGWLIDNATITATGTGSTTWAPATGLYTDVAGTTAYTGGAATAVYASPAATTTYTATVTSAAGCAVTATSTVTVNTTASPSASSQTFCNGATVAELVASGTGTLNWYAQATGGVALVPATALATGTYYATLTDAGTGCESARTAVSVTLSQPAAPTAAPQTFCSAGATIANLSATGAAGSTIQWYAEATGGTPLAASAPLVTSVYYVSQTIDGCEGIARTAVPVTLTGKVWTGATNTDWYEGTNWCENTIPTAVDNVTIPNVTNKPVIGSGVAHANSITITDAAATLTVNSGATLSVEDIIASNTTTANLIVQDNGAIVQGTAATTNANTGKIAFHKNSNLLYRYDYTLWSSPITGQTLRTFAMGTSNNRFYVYDYADNGIEFDEGYWPVDPLTTSFEAAKGYLIRMPNSVPGLTGYSEGTTPYTVDGTFTGNPNNGSYNAGLIQTAGASGFNAVGNPYPSPISVTAFLTANSSNLVPDTGIWFWRKRNNSNNTSYLTLNLTGLVTPPGDTNGNGALDTDLEAYFTGNNTDWIIAPGQGFIVQAQPTATAVSFTNSMRRATPGAQAFFRTAAGTASRYWLNMVGQNGSGSQALVAYSENGTMGIDFGYDSKVFGAETSVSLYSLATDNKLAIQARPEFEAADVVPMGFTAPAAGQYTISIDHMDGVFAQGQNIYLKDLQEGVIRNLSEYDYTFTTEAGTFEGRFEVNYQTQALGNDIPVLDANSVIVFKQGNTIRINTGTALMSGVKVFDVRGRELYNQGGINAAETVISNLNVQQQVLIVEIATDKGMVSKRIVF